jgi:hypothetical protein
MTEDQIAEECKSLQQSDNVNSFYYVGPGIFSKLTANSSRKTLRDSAKLVIRGIPFLLESRVSDGFSAFLSLLLAI